MEYSDLVRDVFDDERRRAFIVKNLKVSMSNLGFSEHLIEDLLSNINNLDLKMFIDTHKDELARVQLQYFFGELVPKYFKSYIIPEVPTGGKILDVGCGRGTLVACLAETGRYKEVVGLDIIAAPEWSDITDDVSRFVVVEDGGFFDFIKNEKPDHITLTWVLHHMEDDQQKRYLRALYEVLGEGSVMVILEDAYSEIIPPESGLESWEEFKTWDIEDRQKIMGAYDWIANRVFSMRSSMPVPFTYRTVEDWTGLFEDIGFTVTKSRFLGFPENRDVNTVQSILVVKK